MRFWAERFLASLLVLTSFGSYNKRVCGSLCSPKCSAKPRTSHIAGHSTKCEEPNFYQIKPIFIDYSLFWVDRELYQSIERNPHLL